MKYIKYSYLFLALSLLCTGGVYAMEEEPSSPTAIVPQRSASPVRSGSQERVTGSSVRDRVRRLDEREDNPPRGRARSASPKQRRTLLQRMKSRSRSKGRFDQEAFLNVLQTMEYRGEEGSEQKHRTFLLGVIGNDDGSLFIDGQIITDIAQLAERVPQEDVPAYKLLDPAEVKTRLRYPDLDNEDRVAQVLARLVGSQIVEASPHVRRETWINNDHQVFALSPTGSRPGSRSPSPTRRERQKLKDDLAEKDAEIIRLNGLQAPPVAPEDLVSFRSRARAGKYSTKDVGLGMVATWLGLKWWQSKNG